MTRRASDDHTGEPTRLLPARGAPARVHGRRELEIHIDPMLAVLTLALIALGIGAIFSIAGS